MYLHIDKPDSGCILINTEKSIYIYIHTQSFLLFLGGRGGVSKSRSQLGTPNLRGRILPTGKPKNRQQVWRTTDTKNPA